MAQNIDYKQELSKRVAEAKGKRGPAPDNQLVERSIQASGFLYVAEVLEKGMEQILQAIKSTKPKK